MENGQPSRIAALYGSFLVGVVGSLVATWLLAPLGIAWVPPLLLGAVLALIGPANGPLRRANLGATRLMRLLTLALIIGFVLSAHYASSHGWGALPILTTALCLWLSAMLVASESLVFRRRKLDIGLSIALVILALGSIYTVSAGYTVPLGGYMFPQALTDPLVFATAFALATLALSLAVLWNEIALFSVRIWAALGLVVWLLCYALATATFVLVAADTNRLALGALFAISMLVLIRLIFTRPKPFLDLTRAGPLLAVVHILTLHALSWLLHGSATEASSAETVIVGAVTFLTFIAAISQTSGLYQTMTKTATSLFITLGITLGTLGILELISASYISHPNDTVGDRLLAVSKVLVALSFVMVSFQERAWAVRAERLRVWLTEKPS